MGNGLNIGRVVMPDGAVPADFNSWRNYIRREIAVINTIAAREKYLLATDEFRFASDFYRSAVSRLRVVWVESVSEQITDTNV